MKDARSNTPEVGEALRERAVGLLTKGWKHADIASALRVAKGTVDSWSHHLRKMGRAAFVADLRKASPGVAPKLTSAMTRRIRNILADKDPEQMKLPFALWTRRAVADLVAREFGVKLSLPSVGNYLKTWGYTPQKPAKAFREQDPEAARRWIEEEYPKVAKKAKKEKATLLWCDETGVTNQANTALGYAPIGETPVRNIPARRSTCSVISAISNRGEMRWMTYHGGLKSPIAVQFLERLVRSNKKRKVILIWDNLRVHKSKEVTKWLAERPKQIEVVYLPAYSPQLNPDERLNRDLKGMLSRKPVATTPKAVRKSVSASLASIAKQRGRIMSYFKSAHTCYAA